MFVCYLDDSYSDTGPVMTMAGYVAPLDAWKAFEEEAEPVFAEHGVKVLHALDFHGRRGEFKNWSAIRRNTFVDQVYAVAARHIPFGLSRSVLRLNYRKRQEETGLNKTVSALGMAFSSILLAVTYRTSISDQIRSEGLSLVVEAGNKHDAEMAGFYQRVRTSEIFGGSAKGLTFVGKGDSWAIQLADFFAFYSRREADRLARFDGKLWLPKEKIFRRFYPKFPHSCLTAKEPYASQLDDWKDLVWDGQMTNGRSLPSERPITPKRQKAKASRGP